MWTQFLLMSLLMKLSKFVLMSCLNLKRVSEFNKKEMFEMLSLTLKESIILFDNKYQEFQLRPATSDFRRLLNHI